MAERENAESEAMAAARDYGRDALENAKSRLADGADRAAGAAERIANGLEDESGQNPISDLGRNLADAIRRLAGGTREHDVELIARELGQLARRKPGVFLAGSVALGFGLARFLKARPQSGASMGDGVRRRSASERGYDAEDALDMSENAQRRAARAASAWRGGDGEPRSSTEGRSTTGGTAS